MLRRLGLLSGLRSMDNPSDKLQKERDQLKILQRNVSDRCRDGSTGIATAIYNFLTDSEGSKRTQGAMKCIKSAAAKVEPPAPVRYAATRQQAPRPRQGSGSNRHPQNQQQSFKTVPANLKCFNCQQNHFQSECPLLKK